MLNDQRQTLFEWKEVKDRPTRAPNLVFVVAFNYQMRSRYILLLQACLSEIYPLCRIGGLLREKRIFYENPVCHQCVFKILYRWGICCNEGQESLFTFLLLFLFKTEFIVIGTWQQLAKVNIASICVDGDANIAPVTSVKNHGSWFDHITPTLIRLHWLPACFTTEYKILILSLRQFMGLHGTIFVT